MYTSFSLWVAPICAFLEIYFIYIYIYIYIYIFLYQLFFFHIFILSYLFQILNHAIVLIVWNIAD
jgi:hypothetical protein